MSKLPEVIHKKVKSKIKGTFSKTVTGFKKENPALNSDEQLTPEAVLQKQLDDRESELTYLKKVFKKNMNEKDVKIESLQQEIEKLKASNKIYQERLRQEVFLRMDEQIKLIEKDKITLKEDLLEEREKIQKNKIKHKKLKQEFKQLSDNYNELNKKYRDKLSEGASANYTEEIQNLIENYKAQITSQELKIESNIEELKNLSNENKKLKQLAKLIIEQRNETEIFFIEALDDVKKELYNRQREMAKRGNFFPTLKKKYEIDNFRVDIRSLGPEAKEQVIRNLFTKINDSYDPEKYKQLNFIMSSDIETDNLEF